MALQQEMFHMRLLGPALLCLLVGCVTAPSEPYLWRDDMPPVGVHRADVARAEARAVEYLASSPTYWPPGDGCSNSPKAYQVITVETPLAYEVRLVLRPGLCRQAPEDTTLPPAPSNVEAPEVIAVSKKDFHIMRVRRWRADESVPMKLAPDEPYAGVGPPPSALAFTTPSLSVPMGDCAGPISVETRLSLGSPKPVAKPVAIRWAAVPPSAVFFSDATCTMALTNVEINAGASSAEVYFRVMQTGPLQITASADEFTSDDQTYTVGSARAVAIAFSTPPQNVTAGACSNAVTLQARDAFDNPASVPAESPVELLATPKSGVKFYASPDCKGAAITRASIPAGGDSASFYFKGRIPRTLVITATLGAVTASQDVVITTAQPSR